MHHLWKNREAVFPDDSKIEKVIQLFERINDAEHHLWENREAVFPDDSKIEKVIQLF